ncbi:MAG: hypothetical protein HC800_21750 [Phormidesmis sp. RL_2_1]|nr:hypothetical protein [Phormidesmis sp. RL_2_1]
MPSISHSLSGRKVLIACFYTALALAAISPAVFAQDGSVTGAKSILEGAVEVSKQSQEGLDDLWQTTFTGNFSPAYQATSNFARQVMVIPFFWLFIPMSRAFVFSRYEDIFKHVGWIILVMMLTLNDFSLTAKLSYGARNWMNATTFTILQQQVGAVSMQDALNDVLLTEQAKSVIRLNFAECEAKEGQEQLKCFNDGATKAVEEIEKAEQSKRWPGTQRLLARLNAVIQATGDTGEELGPVRDRLRQFNNSPQALLDFLFQSSGQALSQELIKGFQQAMVTVIDVGFFLTAMLGPVAAALTLAPLQPRILLIWATGIFSFGLMKMSYNILIGAIATVALLIDATDASSTGLLIAMGVLSPLLAMAMAAWGGARIVHAMVGGATAAIALVPYLGPARGSAK